MPSFGMASIISERGDGARKLSLCALHRIVELNLWVHGSSKIVRKGEFVPIGSASFDSGGAVGRRT